MATQSKITSGLEILLVVSLVVLVLGQALGQPLLLGFVDSGSMEPTIDEGDGFVAIPAPLMGSVDEGDVVVFEAQELHDGRQTTHRVVGETDQGYLTKGDANPFVDQDGDEPPVQQEQIVAKALQINGEVVVIPALGTAITTVQAAVLTVQTSVGGAVGTSLFFGTQGLLNLIVIGCLLLYAILAWRDGRTKHHARTRSRDTGLSARYTIVAITVVVLASVTAVMVVPAGTHQIPVESSADSGGDAGLQPGESVTHPVEVPNSGVLPIVVVFEPQTEGLEADPTNIYVTGRGAARTEVTVTAPAEEPRVNRLLAEHRYLAVLPQPVILTLYKFHPWAPIAVINALLGIPLYLLGIALVGPGRLRDRSRNRGGSLSVRLRRTVQTLYR